VVGVVLVFGWLGFWQARCKPLLVVCWWSALGRVGGLWGARWRGLCVVAVGVCTLIGARCLGWSGRFASVRSGLRGNPILVLCGLWWGVALRLGLRTKKNSGGRQHFPGETRLDSALLDRPWDFAGADFVCRPTWAWGSCWVPLGQPSGAAVVGASVAGSAEFERAADTSGARSLVCSAVYTGTVSRGLRDGVAMARSGSVALRVDAGLAQAWRGAHLLGGPRSCGPRGSGCGREVRWNIRARVPAAAVNGLPDLIAAPGLPGLLGEALGAGTAR